MEIRRWLLHGPLLAPSARRPAIVIICCCALFTVAAGLLSLHQNHGNALDDGIDHWLFTHLVAHWIGMRRISNLTQPRAILALTAVTALCFLAARKLAAAALIAVSIPLAEAIVEFVLKPAVGQTIGEFLSFPSGHTAGWFCLTTAVGVALFAPVGGRKPAARRTAGSLAKIAPVAVIAAISLVVSITVIARGMHYFTDTVVGAAVGIAVALATALCVDLVRDRLLADRPREPVTSPAPDLAAVSSQNQDGTA